MKSKFTKLMAALALLTFLAVPLGMWGQTRSVTYEPATSISAGDVVLLVAEGTNYKKELSGFSTTSTIYGTVADYTTAPAGVYPLTVVAGNSSGSFAFKNSENKYLSWSSGNSLQLSETLNGSSSWTFNYANTVTTLTNVGTTARQIKYNSSSPRFACYTSGQQSIKLYKQVTSSLLDSDLALTGAPVELSFDLYNNASAQTVSFTTSSTGAITVSQSDYITTTVNANNKTITVSPVAVTNGTQTITVSQTATDTYDAGSVTFTVEVTDSTPTTIVTIDDSGITNTDVYVNTEAGSLSATVTSDGNTVYGATVTWSGNNNAVATINESTGAVTLVGVGTVTFTATYAGVSGQYVGSSATYEMTVTSSEPYEQPTTIEIIPNYTFWGKTGQFSGSTYDELDGSQDNVSLHWTRGSGSTYANTQAMRFYKDNNLTFTAPEGYEIISIELSVTGTYDDLTFDPTGFDNETTTWTGAAETVTMSRPSNASSYATISKFTITLAAIGNAVATTTTINVPQDFNTDIYQGTTAGTLAATVSAEGTPISGATVTWSSSNTGVATIDANGEVTLVAVGTTTITASYAGVEDQYRPSEGTYELTVTDSNAPGTQNNPYTVAQARAAIDAGTGTQGVYATGIVSSIETAWSTQYSNITFNFVDNAGDTDFLQAYRCVSGTGVDASTVAVGDIVVVHGNLTKYGSTYEFGQGCELVALTHPTIPFVTVTPSTIDAPFAGAEGTLALTYENIEEFTSFDYYFCDADGNELDVDPDWIQAEIQGENDTYSLYYIIGANNGEARTAYIKVYTTIGDELNPEEVYAIVTVNQAKYVVDYATLPFEFNGGKNAIEETNGLTQSGLGSDYADENTKLKFDGTDDYVILKINERPGTLTFNIKNNSFSGGTFKVQTSEDGVTYTDLKTYTEITGTQDEEFTDLGENVRYIKWVYTNKSSGNVGLGNIALAKYVAPPASITVSNDLVEVDAEEHDGTLGLTYENLTITEMDDFAIQYYDVTGAELNGDDEPDWIEVLVAEQDPTIGEGYVVSYYMVENEGTDARTAYFKVYAMDDETNLVYSNLVTISQAAPVAPATGNEYALYTGELVEGDYLIVYDGGAMNTTVTNDRLQYEDVTVNNDVIVTDNAAVVWHIAPSGQYWTIYNADADAYAASTGVKNKAQMLADGTDDKTLWTVSGTETYEFVNKHNAANSVNANLRKNGTYGFACYATSTGGALSLYKKVESGTPVTQTLSLSEGENWVSFNVKTTLDDLKAALQGVNNATDIKITSQNNGYTYWDGSTWRGTLNPFDVSQMFVIEVIGACEISFEAMPVNPARPITIVNGTNWIGFPFSESMSLSNAFSGFAENGDKILAPNGSFATYNGDNWEGELMELLPGQGYKYEVTTTGERILVFSSSK